MTGRGSQVLKFLSIFLLLTLVLYAGRGVWLPAIGNALIYDEGPAKAEVAVVLAGDPWGHRLTKGAELVRQGYVSQVVVSGPPGSYGFNEADAAIRWATAKGYPAEWFIPLRHTGLSTREEATAVLDLLRERKVTSFLLVTSSYHTGRARRIYLSAEHERGGGPAMRTVASDDRFFSSRGWWQSREGQKSVFFEWAKTVATAFGI